MSKYIFASKHKAVLIILAIFVFMNAYMYLSTDIRHADPDEAVQGIQAKHISEFKELPMYVYGVSYAGGTTMQIYLSSLFYLFFGKSFFYTMLSAFFVSLLLFFLSYFFLRKFFSDSVAFLTMLLISIAPAIYYRLNMHIGYHLETAIFNLILMWAFFNIIYRQKNGFTDYAVFGFLAAISFYVSDSIVILLFTFTVFLFIDDRLFFIRKNFRGFIYFFILGSIPWILYNLLNSFNGLKHLFSETPVHAIVCKYGLLGGLVYCDNTGFISSKKDFFQFILKDLLAFFGTSPYSVLYYLTFLSAVSYLLYHYRKFFRKLFTSIFFRKKISIKECPREIIILSFTVLYIFAYFLRGMGKPRYLFELYLWVPFISVLFIKELYQKGRLYKLVSVSIFCLILIFNLSGSYHATEFKDSDVEDWHTFDIVDTLFELNIRHIYTDFENKWRIAYVSKEKIFGSCDNMCFCEGIGYSSKYPEFEQKVSASSRYGYLVHQNSTLHKKLIRYLYAEDINFSEKEVGSMIIFYDFTGDVRAKDVMINCTTNEYVYR